MAINETRSMNAELDLGALDGSVKNPEPNRGGVVEHTSTQARRGLGSYYEIADGRDIVELPVPRFVSFAP